MHSTFHINAVTRHAAIADSKMYASAVEWSQLQCKHIKSHCTCAYSY
jgi:hypothetical protein